MRILIVAVIVIAISIIFHFHPVLISIGIAFYYLRKKFKRTTITNIDHEVKLKTLALTDAGFECGNDVDDWFHDYPTMSEEEITNSRIRMKDHIEAIDMKKNDLWRFLHPNHHLRSSPELNDYKTLHEMREKEFQHLTH